MARTSFLTKCPRCGYIIEDWTEDGIRAKVCCEMCGYEELSLIPTLRINP